MTNKETFIKEVYFQIANVREQEQEPYYLFVSQENHVLIKELHASNPALFKNAQVDFFESLEVVSLVDAPKDYVEVKGIKTKYKI